MDEGGEGSSGDDAGYDDDDDSDGDTNRNDSAEEMSDSSLEKKTSIRELISKARVHSKGTEKVKHFKKKITTS